MVITLETNIQYLVKSFSYYFDRIRFNVFFNRNHLLSIPELRELNRKHLVDVFDAYKAAQKRGYNSRIEITAPTNATLDIIEKAIRDCYMSVPRFAGFKSINPFMIISKIEIVRDFIVDKESEANLLADRLMSMTGKKYTSSFKIYDAENDTRKNDKKTNSRLKEKIFSTRTGYWGNQKRFEYVVYGRKSKINNLPSAHTEWRIIGVNNIWKKTGIKIITDMKKFDFKKFFEENDKKYLVYKTIDHAALGRWVKGVDGRRKSNKRAKYHGIAGLHFCRHRKLKVPCKDLCVKDECQSLACEINSAAALKQYLKEKKGKIRNRKNKILGNDKHKFFSVQLLQ